MTDSRFEISVVIPVYRSAESLGELYSRLSAALDALTNSWEIVFVNDCSPDASWEKLKALSANDSRVVAVNLMRNFGQQNALMCGFSYSRGDYVVTMDDDLQHPPEEIAKLHAEIVKGEADVVVGSYRNKQHNAFRKFGTLLAKRLANYTLGIPTDFDLTSFRIVRRQIVQEAVKFNTGRPRVGLILFSITTNIVNVETEHHARMHGRSGYTLPRLLGDFVDSILNYSSLPLRLASYLGIGASFISFILAVYYLLLYAFRGFAVSGFATIVVLILFVSGVILLTLGVTGEYLARIIHSSEYNPQFVVREEAGNDERRPHT
jgi:dolichol-phosphate mannosyltransferase/undecaprenyl-phosphate 4-deoxy-4-formamido-L-arabinose transferase